MKKQKQILALLLLMTMVSVFLTGCLKKEGTGKKKTRNAEIVYYKLFDNEDIVKPLLQQYQSLNPGVVIKYRKFSDARDYYTTILNELAEGEGPDIFSVPNYWVLRNSKKLTPIPPDLYSPKTFEETFVNVAYQDSVIVDSKDGQKKVFGVPMAVDTLALYYNKDFYEDKIPERGKPATTWDEFREDTYKLTKADNSFERFEVAGAALGRADNIARALDILMMLMLQYNIEFYNDNYSKAVFAKQQAVDASGKAYNPATEALKLFTSFGLASQKNYSWNEYMVESSSLVKEIEPFARGKVATIFGYSYAYNQIEEQIKLLQKQGVKVINFQSVKTAPAPQVFDPKTATEKRDALANYFVEVVSRNSENADIAWDFLMFMSSSENMKYYSEKTHRPPSRRDLIEEAVKDPIYGVFAEQVGYSESLVVFDSELFNQYLTEAITQVLNTKPVKDAVSELEAKINLVLPPDGFLVKEKPLSEK